VRVRVEISSTREKGKRALGRVRGEKRINFVTVRSFRERSAWLVPPKKDSQCHILSFVKKGRRSLLQSR